MCVMMALVRLNLGANQPMSQEEIKQAKGTELDDSDLEEVAGGATVNPANNRVDSNKSNYTKNPATGKRDSNR